MLYTVGFAVSVWMICFSDGWTDPGFDWFSAGVSLITMVSGAVVAGGLFRTFIAFRRKSADVVARHVATTVIGGLCLCSSEVVHHFGCRVNALQGCVLSICGGALAWAACNTLLRLRGMARGTVAGDIAMAISATIGGGMTLFWMYGVPALRFMAADGMWIGGAVGILASAVLGYLRFDEIAKSFRTEKPIV